MKQKIDYRTLEKEYMTSHISITQLCKRHNCSKSTVSRYAKAHNWESIRNKKQQDRTEKAIEDENNAQDESWLKIKELMRDVINQEWEKVKKGEETTSTVASLSKATKDMKDMGVFGVTTSEKKMLKEIQALDKQLSQADVNRDIVIKFEGGGEYEN